MTKHEVMQRLEQIRASAIPAKLLTSGQNQSVLKLYRAVAAACDEAGAIEAGRRQVLEEATVEVRGVVPPATLALENGSVALLYDLAIKLLRS